MILKPSELTFDDKKFTVIIAGLPGIGKTTLACSAPKPLLIDLDNGVGRVNVKHRVDTDVVQDYEELVEDLKHADLSAYESIIIDTGGKLLEMLKPVVIAEDAKNGMRDGNLSLKGYGAVKRKFAEFTNFVKSLKKNLIYVFHATEVKLVDDTTGLRIRMEGSSKDEVWDDVDIGGFMEIIGKKRTIGFSNCDRYYAKGTYGIHGIYEIPELTDGKKNTFLADLFKQIKKELKKDAEEFELYKGVMNLKAFIEKVGTVEDLNSMYAKVKETEHHLTSKEELWFALNSQAKKLGVAYDKASDSFK